MVAPLSLRSPRAARASLRARPAGTPYDAFEAAYLRNPSNTYLTSNLLAAALLLSVLALALCAWLVCHAFLESPHRQRRGEEKGHAPLRRVDEEPEF